MAAPNAAALPAAAEPEADEEKRSPKNTAAQAAPTSPRDLEVGLEPEEDTSSSDSEKFASGTTTSASEDPPFTSSEAILTGSKPRKSGRRRKVTCTACCCVWTLALIGIAVGLLWPKDPTWDVESITFRDEDIQTVIAAMTDPNFDSVAKLTVKCTVEFFNSNYVGAKAGEGDFDVSLGDLPLAKTVTLAQNVPAHGSSTIDTITEVTLNRDISAVMLPLVEKNNFMFDLNVKGTLPVKVIFGIKTTVGVKCVIQLKALLMLSDPDHMVYGHKCEYTY
eukprot:CAMPEP_0206454058 /NCGR_PEP_ID=MMETSP0324_2-20121206/20915_1 /ASSEMBLY_ACC=CAM_ASM_000836 /TAXON_ID=2866 /ORGANISM="Crypthecodinium cohnii, Strain Seligo" /LENGTH=277 /DNA_ID=CAMNT_0053924467 /DNA_START=111 /DNA_END=944 /DNA_ORIENTATION=-